ncbi:DUF2491 family protein [Caldichromatium japonicum]|uniref:DUF2491 family protein n=1 Tax=Caldichromatium japonicum TaxID=2699430 RepID=A0A6G7VFX2_9GAMM|nr:DUF2491 family protein [Caldichromatium japonicum]QIK38884.1 DUF2491 family protein [Caldichromatium japonicum]
MPLKSMLSPRSGLNLLPLSLVLAIALIAPANGWGKAPTDNSGGVRSSLGVRTPSASPGQGRTASTSAGYRRPFPSAATPAPSLAGSSADRAISRQAARQALDAFRARERPGQDAGEARVRRPSTVSTPPAVRRPSVQWPADLSAPHPAPVASGQHLPARSRLPAAFDWSNAWPWILLAGLAQPGVTEFFYHHAEDSGFRQWRAAAEARAQGDPAVASQLAALDAGMAALSGPRDPSYPPHFAERRTAATAPFPFAALLTGLFGLLLAAILSLLLWRRFFGDVAIKTQRPFSSGQMPRPTWLRPGMLLALDPAPFILGGQTIKVQPPSLGTGGLVEVERLTELAGDGQVWQRLYVAGGTAFIQIHLDKRGQPDECRYFSHLDEVAPADADEWAVWLDPDQGLIGWPEFETKDGVRYQRLWSPGPKRLTPRQFTESAIDEAPCRQQAMLYVRPTGAQSLAPQFEYLWIAAHEQGNGAWVSLTVGIDISPASLNLN